MTANVNIPDAELSIQCWWRPLGCKTAWECCLTSAIPAITESLKPLSAIKESQSKDRVMHQDDKCCFVCIHCFSNLSPHCRLLDKSCCKKVFNPVWIILTDNYSTGRCRFSHIWWMITADGGHNSKTYLVYGWPHMVPGISLRQFQICPYACAWAHFMVEQFMLYKRTHDINSQLLD